MKDNIANEVGLDAVGSDPKSDDKSTTLGENESGSWCRSCPGILVRSANEFRAAPLLIAAYDRNADCDLLYNGSLYWEEEFGASLNSEMPVSIEWRYTITGIEDDAGWLEAGAVSTGPTGPDPRNAVVRIPSTMTQEGKVFLPPLIIGCDPDEFLREERTDESELSLSYCSWAGPLPATDLSGAPFPRTLVQEMDGLTDSSNLVPVMVQVEYEILGVKQGWPIQNMTVDQFLNAFLV